MMTLHRAHDAGSFSGCDEHADLELLEEVRAGNTGAYGVLYERHVAAAYRLARQLARCQDDRDELVSVAFAKVLDTVLNTGATPSAFRAYLLTALRHVAYDDTRRRKRIEFVEDIVELSDIRPETLAVAFPDTVTAELDRSLAGRAFAALPERWSTVLFHTVIAGVRPEHVAPLVGLTPNGVSALAYRAREGLRQRYLHFHLAVSAEQHHRDTERLAAWVRNGLSQREKVRVDAHLTVCAVCRDFAAELTEINSALKKANSPR
jgi:RNA polymerase sigma factor (sigma-70 family)